MTYSQSLNADAILARKRKFKLLVWESKTWLKWESWSWFIVSAPFSFFLFIKQQTEQLFLCHETQTKVCLDEQCAISKASFILSFCFGVNCPALSGGTIQEQRKAKVSKYKSKTLPCARQPNCYVIRTMLCFLGAFSPKHQIYFMAF